MEEWVFVVSEDEVGPGGSSSSPWTEIKDVQRQGKQGKAGWSTGGDDPGRGKIRLVVTWSGSGTAMYCVLSCIL